MANIQIHDWRRNLLSLSNILSEFDDTSVSSSPTWLYLTFSTDGHALDDIVGGRVK